MLSKNEFDKKLKTIANESFTTLRPTYIKSVNEFVQLRFIFNIINNTKASNYLYHIFRQSNFKYDIETKSPNDMFKNAINLSLQEVRDFDFHLLKQDGIKVTKVQTLSKDINHEP